MTDPTPAAPGGQPPSPPPPGPEDAARPAASGEPRHGADPATPTGRDQHTIALLAPERAVRRVPPGGRVCALEAIPGVYHIELEAVRPQIVPGTEGVVD